MSAKRVSLADLGAKAAAGPTDVVAAPVAEPEPDAAEVRPRPQPTRAAPRKKPPKPFPGPTNHLRFDEMERKETRLRADQLEALAAETKRLNRERNRAGDRITDNTLIRVAIDLLLARRSDLAGLSEVELRKSVGL